MACLVEGKVALAPKDSNALGLCRLKMTSLLIFTSDGVNLSGKETIDMDEFFVSTSKEDDRNNPFGLLTVYLHVGNDRIISLGCVSKDERRMWLDALEVHQGFRGVVAEEPTPPKATGSVGKKSSWWRRSKSAGAGSSETGSVTPTASSTPGGRAASEGFPGGTKEPASAEGEEDEDISSKAEGLCACIARGVTESIVNFSETPLPPPSVLNNRSLSKKGSVTNLLFSSSSSSSNGGDSSNNFTSAANAPPSPSSSSPAPTSGTPAATTSASSSSSSSPSTSASTLSPISTTGKARSVSLRSPSSAQTPGSVPPSPSAASPISDTIIVALDGSEVPDTETASSSTYPSSSLVSLSDRDYERVVLYKLAAAGTEFTFEDYSPNGFSWIRQQFGITNEKYCASMQKISGGGEGAGKSGSWFFTSEDGRYIVKTLTSSELSLLFRRLPEYTNYLAKNPDTLLPHFYGLYRLKLKNGNICFVVMRNILNSRLTIHEVYDVKGSTHGRLVDTGSDGVGGGGADDESTTVLKDLNFKRTLWMRDKKAEFMAQLVSDVTFLESRNLIDYSLLIGIHRCPQTFLNPAFYIEHGMSESDFAEIEAADQKEYYNSLSRWQGTENGFKTGENEDDPYGAVYFLGIIDILQEYNIKKKLERTYKMTMVKDANSLSVIDAVKYRDRFLDFIGSISA